LSEKSPPADTLSSGAIEQRAYYLWEADGRPEGRSEHYWQMALAEAQAAAKPDKPAKAKAPAKTAAKPAKAAAAEKPKKPAKKADEKPAKKAATKPRASVASKSR
jgi:hypothetical protein